jgi:protoporphyrinogen/coproporphyrinogen III oxidase
MAERINKIIVLGAGISGLSTAYWLTQEGYDVMVLESDASPGGSVKTITENGFLIDQGPNSGLDTSPAIKKLVDKVGLNEQMIYANEEAKKRYILRDGRLLPLPTNPLALIKSRLFTPSAKMRLLMEPFIGRSQDGYYQSVAEFVKRRLGQEFLDYAIDPFVSGVFAGDPGRLSVQSAFPRLYDLEEKYGGLIRGMIKGSKERRNNPEVSKQAAKMFSFKNGMSSLIFALADKLGKHIKYNAQVESVKKAPVGYRINYVFQGKKTSILAETIISTIPAYRGKDVFGSLDKELAKHLDDVYYPPVMTLYLGYKKKDSPALDGFGFLIPSNEQMSFLGAIWNSAIFPGRAPDDSVSFTLFIGGARNANVFDQGEDKIINQAIQEFENIMGIKEKPVIKSSRLWKKAIPQYNIGYIEHENYFSQFEETFPGLYLAGNYRGGISFGDCIRNSGEIVERVFADMLNLKIAETKF